MTENKSMLQQWRDGEIRHKEYMNYLAHKNGFKDIKDYLNYMAQKRGYKDDKDYQNSLSQKNGFKDKNEHDRSIRHKKGISLPFSENKECASYLGVHIAERLLSKIFENVTRMPYGNPSYDFICGKGYKIDVKSSCLRYGSQWNFTINKNKIADYFLLLGFDNRRDLNPQHVWIIGRNEIIHNRKSNKPVNQHISIFIKNCTTSMNNLRQYEQTNKLVKLVACCNTIKKTEDK
jgi:hypothetical protein